jgi:uncharacterized membrane protein
MRKPRPATGSRPSSGSDESEPSSPDSPAIEEAKTLQVIVEKSLDAGLRREGIIVPPQKEHAVAQRVTVAVQQAVSYQAPIPPPGMLREFDDVVPGLAREIADAFNEERKHRHRWENKALYNDIFSQSGAIFLGWLLAAACAAGAFYLALQGNNAGATIMFSVPLVTIVRSLISNGSRIEAKGATPQPVKPPLRKRR